MQLLYHPQPVAGAPLTEEEGADYAKKVTEERGVQGKTCTGMSYTISVHA